MDIIALNHISVQEMKAEEWQGRQTAELLLKGNVKQEEMRRLLCQLAKEAENFKIQAFEG